MTPDSPVTITKFRLWMFKRQGVERAVVDFWRFFDQPSERNKVTSFRLKTRLNLTATKTRLNLTATKTGLPGQTLSYVLAFSVHCSGIACTFFLEHCSTTLSIAQIASVVADE